MTGIDLDFINKAVNKDFVRTIKKVYIDLAYIQDVYLGGILLKNLNEQAYNHIFSNLNAYNNRVTISRTQFFPDLNETEESILEYITDRENVSRIIAASPTTDIFDKLPEFHRENVERNRILAGDDHKDDTIEYVINHYPLELTTDEMLLIKTRMFEVTENPVVGFISTPLKHLPATTISRFDTFFIENISHVTDQDGQCYKHFFIDNLFRDKIVFTPRRINCPKLLETISVMSQEQIAEAIQNAGVICNLLTTYIYTDIKIDTGESTSN
jgi:hypothetical protein